jgi:hypothetical protein
MPDAQQLLDEVALRARDDRAGRRVQQHALLGGEAVAANDEHAAANCLRVAARARLRVPHEVLQMLLHARRVRHRLVIAARDRPRGP